MVVVKIVISWLKEILRKMRSLSTQALLEIAKERASEEKRMVNKILQRSQAILLSIKSIIERPPENYFYEEMRAEASFRIKVLGLLGEIVLPSEPETSKVKRFIKDLYNFQVEVSRTGARLIPKFDRSRKMDVAELEIKMKELAKIAAQLQSIPKEKIRILEETEQILERIKIQNDELKRLKGEKEAINLEIMKLRDEDALLKKEMAELDGSELSSKIRNIEAEILNVMQKSEAMFIPMTKPIEKLRKLLKDQGDQYQQLELLLKCIEDPMELSKIDLVDLERAVQILRIYIEKGDLSIKQSISKRALESISEMRSEAQALKEKIISLLKVKEAVLKSSEAEIFSIRQKTLEDRLRRIGDQLSALSVDRAKLDERLEKCSSRMERLKREVEKIAESIVSEPISIVL
ncbi:MAG: hypothetical protein ACUVTL_03885 [Thermoproteota archaeon]